MNKKTVLFNLLCICLSVFCAIAFCEVILRFMGHKPWSSYKNRKITIEPGGKLCNEHSTLGHTYFPGKFEVIIKDEHKFVVTHNLDNRRITSRLNHNSSAKEDLPEVWIFGCSFTHGWSVNDEETFPWLVQKSFPNYQVVNFGVGGYGNVHSMIQFKEALRTGSRPFLVILTYADFHDIRNSFTRSWKKKVSTGTRWKKVGVFSEPYAFLNRNGMIEYSKINIEYTEIPLMRYSALAHLLEKAYNKMENSRYKIKKVSKEIILDFYRLAEKTKIPFVIAGIDPAASGMLEDLKSLNLHTVDISVDYSLRKYNNVPFDSHPNAEAHKLYAKKLNEFLENNSLLISNNDRNLLTPVK